MPSPDILNSLVLLGIAAFNVITAYLAWRTHVAVQDASDNIQKIETATNSMKDALVDKTDRAARAEGKEEGRIQEEARVKQ